MNGDTIPNAEDRSAPRASCRGSLGLLATITTALLTLSACADGGGDRSRCLCRAPLVCDDRGLCVPPGSDDAGGLGDAIGDDATGGCSVASARIHEFAPNMGDEPDFVEIAGPVGAPVDGLSVVFVDGNRGEAVFEIALQGTFDAAGLFVVAESDAIDADMVAENLELQTGPDAIELRGCGGALLDAVAYGSFEGATDLGEGSPAPKPGRGEALARCPSDADSDDNGADFHLATPTPGSANDGFLTPLDCATCEPESHLGVVTISELLYDPEGSDDAERAFVELSAPAGTNLTGLRLEAVDGASGSITDTVFLDGAVDASGLFVVGGSSVGPDQIADTNFQNGPDSVRLVACDDSIVDAVAYGEFEEGESAFGEGAPSVDASDGESLARCAGAADTDDNATDFGAATPSPGAPNGGFVDEGFCEGAGCAAAASGARIDEVGRDRTGWFVEVSWPAADPDARELTISLGDESLPLIDGVQYEGRAIVTLAEPDATSGGVSNGAGRAALEACEARVLLDEVAWGDGAAAEGDPAPAVPTDGSIGRCPEGDDTNDNADDFGQIRVPSPGVANPRTAFVEVGFCGSVGCALDGVWRIEELFVNPEGSDGGLEWVEIRGPSDSLIEDVRLEGVNGSSGEIYLTIDLDGRSNSDGLFVLGGDEVPEADQVFSGTLQNGPDGVRLVGCDDVVLDLVGYGSFGDDDVLIGEGEPVLAAAEGRSLARCPEDPDRDDNARDFSEAEGTPGAPNTDFSDPLFCGGSCDPSAAASMRINEVLYDPPSPGSDDGREFIELRGAADVPLDGLSIVAINGNDDSIYLGPIFLEGASDVDGYFVIGGASVPEADQRDALGLQNGPDAIRLLNCDGRALDAVGYGDPEGPFAGEGLPAPDPSGQSIGRCPGGTDTDDNAADFGTLDETSPGAENTGFESGFCSED